MQTLQHYLENDIVKLFAIYLGLALLSIFVNKIVFRFLSKIFMKTSSTIDEEILVAIRPPINYFFVVMGIYFTNEILKYKLNLDTPLKALFAIFIFWLLFRLVEPFKDYFLRVTDRFGTDISEDLAEFLIKSIKVFIFLIGMASVLQTLGYDVTSFVASLGLGGLAFALAAKDTAANLFGSLVIFGDRPFKVGDWIQTNAVEGVVEEIGIRSTKIRTFDNSIITVPNANLANTEITNWTKMDKRRVKMEINLTYNTKPDMIQSISKSIVAYLNGHVEVDKDTIIANFTDFKDSSLAITIVYHTKTISLGEYYATKETVNYEILKIVEESGASFAYPTRSLYIEKE